MTRNTNIYIYIYIIKAIQKKKKTLYVPDRRVADETDEGEDDDALYLLPDGEFLLTIVDFLLLLELALLEEYLCFGVMAPIFARGRGGRGEET
jgi:hypothetical protein